MPTIFYRYRRTAFLAEANANTLPIRRCACSQTMPIRWVLLNRNKTCAANSVVRYSPNIVEAPALYVNNTNITAWNRRTTVWLRRHNFLQAARDACLRPTKFPIMPQRQWICFLLLRVELRNLTVSHRTSYIQLIKQRAVYIYSGLISFTLIKFDYFLNIKFVIIITMLHTCRALFFIRRHVFKS